MRKQKQKTPKNVKRSIVRATFRQTTLQKYKRMADPKHPKILVLFDLNGTLIDRSKERNKYGKQIYKIRPGWKTLVNYLSKSQLFCVGLWTSAMRHNMIHIVNKLLGNRRIACFLHRGNVCLKDEMGKEEWSTVKDLRFIWKKSGDYWNERNTIIVDDTPSKVRLQPENAIRIPSCKGKLCVNVSETKCTELQTMIYKSEVLKDNALFELLAKFQEIESSNFGQSDANDVRKFL